MEKFIEAVAKYELLKGVSKVYVALSGGPDSMVLLHLFKNISLKVPITVEAIHINHSLRAVSDREAELVMKWCDALKITCHIEQVDVKGKMGEGYAMEEAARICRYEVFSGYLKEKGAKVALGHHRDDQAETVLMNFFRGSGLKGLGGMLPERDGYIRPMLEVSRDEIVTYCKKNAIEYVTDESNKDTAYRRNLLRHDVIPYLEKQLGVDIGLTLARTSGLMQDEESMICLEVDRRFKEAKPKIENDRIAIRVECLLEQPVAMQRRLIRRCIAVVTHSLWNISSDHIASIRQLLTGESGKQVDLPNGIKVSRDYEWLVVTTNHEPKFFKRGETQTCILEDFEWNDFPKKPYTKWFDYDKIRGNLTIRTRNNGDYIRIGANLGKKKLKDYFIDMKLSKDLRDLVPILTDENEVLWIVGYRMNDAYKVTEKTQRVLEVTYIEYGDDSAG